MAIPYNVGAYSAIVGLMLIGHINEVLLQQNRCPDVLNQFYFLGNNTCMDCPPTCLTCFRQVADANYPCATCPDNLYFQNKIGPSGNYEGEPGICTDCNRPGFKKSDSTTRVSMVKIPSTSAGQGGQIFGRLQVYYYDRYGTVCDDGWTDENTEVACRELGYGKAVSFYPVFDGNYSYLRRDPILVDNVRCKGNEDSILKCKHRGPAKHNCASVETIGITCSGPESNKRCLKQCPIGQFYDNTTKTCTQCHRTCLECSNISTRCISCEDGKFLRSDNNCIIECGEGFYGNTERRQCQPCSASCRTCADGTRSDTCTSCPDAMKLVNSSCGKDCPKSTFLMENDVLQCVRQCPKGYLGETQICVKCASKCKACNVTPDNCTSCQNGYVLQPRKTSRLQMELSLGSCQVSCDSGFYQDPFSLCRKCQQVACDSCYPGGEYCQTCQSGYLLEMGKCTRRCSPGLFPNKNICLAECENGYYGDLQSARCQACPPNCQRCDDAATCRKCSDGYYVRQGECVSDCGDGMLSVGAPHNRLVRLTGGIADDEGRVEIYYKGIWGHVCSTSWDIKNADVVCRELGIGKALKITRDIEFGSSGIALSGNIRCHGNETSLLSCMHDIPAAFTYCNDRVAGVFCSGPTPRDVRACRLRNAESCAVAPCHVGVACTDYPEGEAAYVQGSYCGPCPQGYQGNGVDCQEASIADPVIRYPPVQELEITFWPEAVRLDLPCVTSDSSQMTFRWSKNEEPMQNTAFYRISASGTLTIFEPRGESDSALYTCVVSNGKTENSVFYKLSVQEKVEITSGNGQITGSGRIALDCDVIGYPAANVTWFKDGEQIIENDNYKLEKKTIVITDGKTPEQSGNYTCFANNGFSSRSKTSSITISAPVSIKEQPKHLVAVIGQKFDYTCEAEGSPSPRIYWKKNGEDILNSSRFWSNQNGHLYIREVEMQDGGEYTCVATADGLHVQDVTINITVLELPMVSITPSLLSIPTGVSAVFQCTARGQPMPHVRWMVPSRGILSTSESVEDSGRSELTLSDVIPSDAGEVICMATNSAGQVNYTAVLEVKFAPMFEKPLEAVYAQQGWPLLLPWKVKAVPAAEIHIFKDNINITDDVLLQSNGILIPHDFPLSSGNLVVRANNSQGDLVGQALVTVVKTLPNLEVQRKTPTNITVSMRGIPQQPDGATHEVWVVNLGQNETFEEVTISPIHLQELENDQGIFLFSVFTKLPSLVIIGDNSSDSSKRSKRDASENSPLSPKTWYAICLRVMTLDATYARPIVPLAATNYIYVFTENDATGSALSSSSLANWEIALAILGAIILFILLVMLISLWCRHDQVDWHAPVRWIKGLGNKKSLAVEGPIDVEAVLDQFNPHGPSRGRLKRGHQLERALKASRHDTQLAKSSLSKPSTHKNELVDPADVRIQDIRRPLVEQELIYKSPSRKAISESGAPPYSRDHIDAYLSRATSDPQLSSAERPFLEKTDADHDDLQKKNSHISQGSKKSDSGFESENLPKLRKMQKSRQRDITAMMGYHGLINSDMKPSKRKFIPAAWRQFYLRKKAQRRAGRNMNGYDWIDRENDFLSWSKKWARQMLERGHYSDDDSIISSRSGDSDIEMHMFPDGSPSNRKMKRAHTHDSIHDIANADLNHSYADLADIQPLQRVRSGTNTEVTYTNPGFQPDDPTSPAPGPNKKAQYSETKKVKSKATVDPDVYVTQAFIHRDPKVGEESPVNCNETSEAATQNDIALNDNSIPTSPAHSHKSQSVQPPKKDSFSEMSPVTSPEKKTTDTDNSEPPERESGDGQDHSTFHGSTTSPTSHSSHGYITLVENNEAEKTKNAELTREDSDVYKVPPSSSPRFASGSGPSQSTSSMPVTSLVSTNHSLVTAVELTNGVHPSPRNTYDSLPVSQTITNGQASFPMLTNDNSVNTAVEESSMGETAYLEMKPSFIDISENSSPVSTPKHGNPLEFPNKSFKFLSSDEESKTEILPIIENSKPRKLYIPEVFKH